MLPDQFYVETSLCFKYEMYVFWNRNFRTRSEGPILQYGLMFKNYRRNSKLIEHIVWAKALLMDTKRLTLQMHIVSQFLLSQCKQYNGRYFSNVSVTQGVFCFTQFPNSDLPAQETKFVLYMLMCLLAMGTVLSGIEIKTCMYLNRNLIWPVPLWFGSVTLNWTICNVPAGVCVQQTFRHTKL